MRANPPNLSRKSTKASQYGGARLSAGLSMLEDSAAIIAKLTAGVANAVQRCPQDEERARSYMAFVPEGRLSASLDAVTIRKHEGECAMCDEVSLRNGLPSQFIGVPTRGFNADNHCLRGLNGREYREVESNIWMDEQDAGSVLYVSTVSLTGDIVLRPMFVRDKTVWRNVFTGRKAPFRLLDASMPHEDAGEDKVDPSNQAERVLANLDWEARCKALLHVTESFAWAATLEDAHQNVCDALAEVLLCDEAHLHIKSIDGTRFIKCAYHVNGPRTHGWENGHSATIGRMQWMLDVRRPIIMDYEHPHFNDKVPPQAFNAGVKGGVTIPLQAGGEVVGTCSAIYRRRTDWSGEDEEFLLMIGRAIGTFIKRLQDTQKAAELEILDERRRLSGEIHDNVSTLIGSLSLHAAAAQSALDEGDTQAASRGLGRLESIAVDTMRILRDEMISLRLPLEKDDGFSEGLRDLLQRYEQSWGIATEFDDSGYGLQEIPLQISIQLTRIFNECLSNTLRHADAHGVKVVLASSIECITLCLEDDGKGFDVDAVSPERFGLKIMKERALAIGGQLEVLSNSAGTSVCVTVPCVRRMR